MSSPRTTRRYAILLYAAVCFLVLGGLAWASYSAIELERGRLDRAGRDATSKSYRERLVTALWQIDGYIQPVWARELGRPYTDYLPFYTPSELRYGPNGMPVTAPLQVPSPLLLETREGTPWRPAWLLLNFQGSESTGWTSPQLPGGPSSHVAAWEVPPERRQRAHWLNALSRMYDPEDLQRLLEDSRQLSERLRGRAIEGSSFTDKPSPAEKGPAASGLHSDDPKRSGADYLRRGDRARQLGMQSLPPEQCVLERVFTENLPAGLESSPGEDSCVCVRHEPMTPVWLELMGPGEPQLAFIRKVTVESSSAYVLQGVLIDWPRLRATLEEEAGKLFPGAKIIPVRPGDAVQPDALPLLMTTLSARLVAPPPVDPPPAVLSTGLKTGLSAAWIVALLALSAIGYGAMKYVTLAERRMRFVSAVTHELRTPLTTFQLYTDLLADETNGQGRQSEYIDTLRGESKRLSRLVENVLAYSRMGRQTPVLQRRAVRPGVLLDAARAAMTEICASAEKTVVLEDRCPVTRTIETDAEFVVQILCSLIENACKYGGTAQDGNIWLTAREEPGRGIVLEVEDPGPGIAPHDKREVFRAFRRGRNGQEAATQGIGLGLALSRHWAKCLGGDLIVKRGGRNPGRYACFVLSLPGSVRESIGSTDAR